MLGQNLLSLATEFGMHHSLENHIKTCHHLRDAKDGFGRTVLHIAAANTKADAADFLVKNGFDGFRERDDLGLTPLHIACQNG